MKMKEALAPLQRENEERIAAAEAELVPLQEEYADISAKMDELNTRRLEIAKKIHTLEKQHNLHDSRRQLAAIARAINPDRVLVNEPRR